MLKRDLARVYEGKHLPGCYDQDLPLDRCICGGPERQIFLEVMLADEAEPVVAAKRSAH